MAHPVHTDATHHAIDPLLVAFHAVTWVDHDKLPGVVDAALVPTNLTLGTQHPELHIPRDPTLTDALCCTEIRAVLNSRFYYSAK